MAICFPDYEIHPASFESRAEEKLYWALREQLPENYSVFHSVAWIGRSTDGASDGEADFLVCHPLKGILVIEVKGGGISVDGGGEWSSTDGKGVRHRIKDPFSQGRRGKYNCLQKLKEHADWRRLGLGRIGAGHAVFFPDLHDGGLLRGPDAPIEIIGDRQDLVDVRNWVDAVYVFWSGENQPHDRLGTGGVDLVRKVFARTTSARPLISARIAEEEEERIKLTNQQMSVLDLLSRQRRVLISGGAGTGKTLIAREKALRLAREGFRTLLTCYNRPLADHLRESTEELESLDIASFHQLCHHWIERAKKELDRDLLWEARSTYPGQDEFDVLQPIALAFAAEAFGAQYDAVIVDEGQDFGDEYWMPIEFLLRDQATSPLYIFIDENQDVYSRSPSFPITSAPAVLTRNCRNTHHIHSAAYRYYRGQEVEAPPIVGGAVMRLEAPSEEKQADLIARQVTKLVAEEGVAPSDIAILIGDRPSRAEFERLLIRRPLPSEARWSKLEAAGPGSVTVETVARFKGLERQVIVLWGVDNLPDSERCETLYVGLSRAKSLLFICGSRAGCQSIEAGRGNNV